MDRSVMYMRALLWMCLPAAFALSACACEPLPAPVLQVEETVDFGVVEEGQQVARQVLVSNLSARDQVISRLAWVKEPALAFEFGEPDQTVVPAGGTVWLPVTFKPKDAGSFVATLVIHQEGVAQADLARVQLQGIGKSAEGAGAKGPRVATVPVEELNLGRVPLVPEAPARRHDRIRIFNVGSAGSVLKVLQVVVERDGDASQEPLLRTLPPLEERVAEPGDFVEVGVQFLPESLGEKRWTVRIHTNDETQPMVTLSVVAQVTPPGLCTLEVWPRELSFGLIEPPNFRDLSVTVKNVGTGVDELCVLWDFQPPPDLPFITLPGAPKEPVLLRPQQTVPLHVRVHGGSWVQWFEGKVTFRSSSELRPVEEITFNGRQVAPSCLTVAPDDVDFGTLHVGCTSTTRTFSIYNTCASDVHITSLEMMAPAGQPAGGPDCPGSARCPEFLLTQAPAIPAGGIVLKPGQPALTFQVQYQPIDMGADSGALAIEMASASGPVTYAVSLKGNGVDWGDQKDVFVQGTRIRTDVLLVLDTSPSMAMHQINVAANLEWLRDHLLYVDANANIGVLTADPADGLVLTQLNSLSPTFIADFDAAVAVGTQGSGGRACLERALQALSPAMRAGPNAGFLRSSSQLSVVCITDGEDQSPGTAADYGAALENLSPHAAFDVLGAQTATCPGDSGKLADVAALRGGVAYDICSGELGAGIGYVPWHQVRSTFFLTSVPTFGAASLDVHIDGVPAVGWTFDAAANAIHFDPAHVPPEGSTITVSYARACYP